SGAVVSLASTSTGVAALSSATVRVSSTASGGSFTGVTVTVTVAGSVRPLLSVTVYLNVVVPWKLGAGVDSTTPAVSVTVPPVAAWVPAVTVNVSPVSGAVVSLASTFTTVAPLSSATVRLSSIASGGLPSTTSTVTVAVSVPPLPSEIVYVNVA